MLFEVRLSDSRISFRSQLVKYLNSLHVYIRTNITCRRYTATTDFYSSLKNGRYLKALQDHLRQYIRRIEVRTHSRARQHVQKDTRRLFFKVQRWIQYTFNEVLLETGKKTCLKSSLSLIREPIHWLLILRVSLMAVTKKIVSLQKCTERAKQHVKKDTRRLHTR